MPHHRLVLALLGGEVIEVRGASSVGTFRAYRGLADAVHGMIAWPNTLLATGSEPIVVDPGYQTQGDMLQGALTARGLDAAGVATAILTHAHPDHVSALPQLGEVDLYVHEAELDAPHGRLLRGMFDAATLHPLAGDSGEIRPGVRWVHTPGHSPGHIAVAFDTDEGVVVAAGDTLGPDPDWFPRMDLPEGFPERDAHLAAFSRIRELGPVRVIPGHNPPVEMPTR